MDSQNFLFTSESVSEGHPDKICDQVSDAIVDMHLKLDPNARVACETLAKTGLIMIAGEIRSNAKGLDYAERIREVINEIGYDHSDKGFDGNTCGIMVALEEQSKDIALGVDATNNKEQGAGDQGMMFGYACDETPELMPMSILYSHRLLERYAEVRKNGVLGWARPDCKSQVTIEYVDNKPSRVHTIVMSAQHSPDIDQAGIAAQLQEHVVKHVIPAELLDDNTVFHFNPTGKFVIGGPMGDCGLTGRKIIVDTYGGHGAHGGGAFSGKDPSKVDRSAAYMSRYIAKNLVAAGYASRCLVQLAYAIGVADPVSIMVETYGTGKVSNERLAECIKHVFPCRPGDLISHLNLLRPIYQKTAAYGHFGREIDDFTWERTDKVEEVSKFLG
jgi:S-adenosylmethionine synthetase